MVFLISRRILLQNEGELQREFEQVNQFQLDWI